MAKAYKCDRCGQYFDEKANEYNEALDVEFDSIALTKPGLVERLSVQTDFCPDCLMQFSLWFENFKGE